VALTQEQLKKLAVSIEDMNIRGAKERSVRNATWLISCFVSDLRSGAPISQRAREFFAEALERAVANPKNAGAALGLIPPKARPKKDTGTSDTKVGLYLEAKVKSGFPLRSGKRFPEGAFASAAKKFHMSESNIERAWKRHREIRALLEESWKQRVAEGSIQARVKEGDPKK